MSDYVDNSRAKANDLAMLISAQGKRFIFRLANGAQFQTHRGIIEHDAIIGCTWGSGLESHLGSPFVLLQPSLDDILIELKRNTQIMYPKDIGFVLMKMGIGPGLSVIEAGTGSGGLTTALAYIVGPEGMVYSYDFRSDIQRLALKNLERIGLETRATLKLRNIGDGFDEKNVDALFLDVPNPYDYLTQAWNALKPGGAFGAILPTTNQVTILLSGLRRENFGYVEVCEILIRYYKPVSERLRPTDRMVAHTGYLIFARSILPERE
jgi:tRNA (adenine57-N1/adenine58-N1)-methyltransferase catalytic subunit